MIRTMKWIGAIGLAAMLPTGLFAQTPPAGTPAKPKVAIASDIDAYRAATPYSPIVVNRPAPNPINNYPNFILECGWPNQNFEPYVHPCDCDKGKGCGSCGHGECGSCGSIFNRSSCGGCSQSCGAIFNRSHCGCKGNSCGASCSRSNCGGCHRSRCNSGCTGCTASASSQTAAIRQTGGIEQVNWWKQRDPAPVPAAEACPNCPPATKHRLPTAASLGCTNCGTWESERVFIFGSCRQFFGEPTHHWLHGSK